MDASRKRDARQHRRKRRKQRMSSFVIFTVVGGAALGAAYVGWVIYEEQRAAEEAERVERQAELEAERARRTTDDLITDLSESPRWNGPGAPAFGVGEEPTDAVDDRIVVTLP